ncbi:hypothetical protein [Oceanobacter mangrovi]|uniref:hypothetical protein n=1 Tax=Oceanobacter mangrovi TaxID=2862510 RepID=UPI001C8DD7AF|nr:hypothetical protein [Oceanobacter mangrovi]
MVYSDFLLFGFSSFFLLPSSFFLLPSSFFLLPSSSRSGNLPFACQRQLAALNLVCRS